MSKLEEALAMRRKHSERLAAGSIAVSIVTPDPVVAARLIDHAVEQIARARR